MSDNSDRHLWRHRKHDDGETFTVENHFGQFVAEVHGEAQAQLIAAAPELLEVLQAIRPFLAAAAARNSLDAARAAYQVDYAIQKASETP